ncbi:hypothetical protein N7532_007108 [Penicillium argentinense]|uniref:Zn(2)-C6 fungal-type domain-containing protein n=1 Tax=Penicillium argentinense TaxID=1131581 RepID=A0A9W9FH58_9EURO|nr:uncharacterized protein N7532_007108 [Penicillium argentinense]KAJ5100107.1 hypothetical protein N7532_007108 [Penicillium argentinense]
MVGVIGPGEVADIDAAFMMKHSEEPGRPKRRKIAVACDDCRARKVRCDGVQPVCGQCSRRSDDSQCVYTGELEKRRATQTYISSLEDRIKKLESPNASERASQSGLTPHHASLPSLSPGITTYPETPANRTRTAECPGEPSAARNGRGDGVNAMMGAVEERPSQGFFGSSSAAGFMRQIKTAVDKRVSSPDRRPSSPGISPRSSLLAGRNERTQVTAPNYVLPPRRTADNLMDVYWDYVFPLYPFVDRSHMKSEYVKVWQGEAFDYDENMVMCTFNVIFALASQLADFIVPEEREASADAFFFRAKGLFQFSLWDTGSAGLIQCLLLMAQYLQSTDSAHQCWIVTGLATRNAQSLGLHLPQTIARFSNFQEQQLARKLWHGCVLMDRVISMTFGRPAMISKTSSGAVPLPVNVDDEFVPVDLTSEPAQPPQHPSIMAFYAKTLELYEIMNDVLLSFYKPIADDIGDDIHDLYFSHAYNEGERTIFELDRSLTRWTRSLLLISTANLRSTVTTLFSFVKELFSARDIYTAATVLIAGRLCPAILSEITESSIARSWNCALEILRKYQSYSTSARRCIAALEILYEQVVSESQDSTGSIHLSETPGHCQNTLHDISFGENISTTMMEHFEFPDFQDMSWLNSVPSNLF